MTRLTRTTAALVISLAAFSSVAVAQQRDSSHAERRKADSTMKWTDSTMKQQRDARKGSDSTKYDSTKTTSRDAFNMNRNDTSKAGNAEANKAKMANWPAASKKAVEEMTARYGAPASVTEEMAVWGKTGPWKRSVVYGTGHDHQFPVQHDDVLQQWVDYKVPTAKYGDVARYNGSVVLERTAGEMSARCSTEGANFLAINLAHEMVTGKRSLQAARKMYGEQIAAMTAGRPAPMTERLMFESMTDTGDPDAAIAVTRASASDNR